ncbi:hypothetical protein AcW1_006379 [Taiwanofungus camphoratus]|nr:hypothetical protein AcW1_006379 [Antrodia cinnamomea]
MGRRHFLLARVGWNGLYGRAKVVHSVSEYPHHLRADSEENDRTDPYLAVYTPPSPCQIEDVTHVQWTGLLSPAFVQIVMEAVFSPPLNQMTFLSLVGHSIPNSPVTYISPSAPFHSPLRAPRSESEDTWCLIVAKGPNDSETRTGSKWVLAETVGQWDTRWG